MRKKSTTLDSQRLASCALRALCTQHESSAGVCCCIASMKLLQVANSAQVLLPGKQRPQAAALGGVQYRPSVMRLGAMRLQGSPGECDHLSPHAASE